MRGFTGRTTSADPGPARGTGEAKRVAAKGFTIIGLLAVIVGVIAYRINQPPEPPSPEDALRAMIASGATEQSPIPDPEELRSIRSPLAVVRAGST